MAPKPKQPKKSEQIGGAPPLTASTRQPIGVPDYYLAPPNLDRSVGRAVGDLDYGYPVPPRYFVGHEWRPASLPAEDIARLQAEFVEAGLIRKGTKFRLGTWDEQSRAAYADLLAFANASGLEERQALRRYAEGRARFGDDSTRAPLTVELTNPTTLRKIIERGARETIGRRLSPEETTALVNAYQAQERSYQESAYASAEEGGSVVSPPDPLAFAEEEIERRNPVEAGAKDIVAVGNEFRELLDEVNSLGI